MGRATAGRRACAREGCRAWARRGWQYCAAHGRQIVAAAERAPAGNGAEATASGAAWVRGQWAVAELRRLEELAAGLTSGAATGLAGEIGAARLALARLLRQEDDPVRLADGIAKAASVVFKARQLERLTSGEAADSLAGAATRILEEMGYGQGE